MPTYVDLIASRLPSLPFRGRMGERFAGLIGGLTMNLVAEAASYAIQALWLIKGQPEDDLNYAGAYKSLFRYISETAEQYRQRLENAVALWETGGSEDLLEGQYAAAGYVGTTLHSPLDWGRSPLNWPTQIWGFLPREAHLDGSLFHRAGAGALAGAPTSICGTGTFFKHATVLDTGALIDGHLIGITGPIERVVEVQRIIKTFKAGHEVARSILIEVDGHACGGGALAGAGELCGGAVVAIGMGVAEE